MRTFMLVGSGEGKLRAVCGACLILLNDTIQSDLWSLLLLCINADSILIVLLGLSTPRSSKPARRRRRTEAAEAALYAHQHSSPQTSRAGRKAGAV